LSSAKADLNEIHIYITGVSGNADVGRSFVTKIQAKCEDLAALPGTMGRPRPEYLPDMRSYAYGDYIIFFRYAGNFFEVVNILEGHRDADGRFLQKD
jgi:plasmid stabilization system protein ParE